MRAVQIFQQATRQQRPAYRSGFEQDFILALAVREASVRIDTR
jgi:hypothetical protein